MSFPFFDAPEREPSRRLGFAGNTIERRSEERDDEAAREALRDPSSRLVLVAGGRAVLRAHDGTFEALHPIARTTTLQPLLEEAVLLGWTPQGPVLAALSGVAADALPENHKAIDLRSIHAQGLLDPQSAGALAQGAALLSWHASHRFCSRCGHRSEIRAGGYKRHCPGCGAEHFPRTDPVAIMLAVRGQRCLLGRSPHFPPGMYSALAGFIEPGETIEDAVRRETLEESGIAIGRVAYHASQPWPFPYSLMIGCYGEALDETVSFDGRELQDCRWFSREEVALALDGGHPDGVFVPPRAAIAHQLIRTWAEAA